MPLTPAQNRDVRDAVFGAVTLQLADESVLGAIPNGVVADPAQMAAALGIAIAYIGNMANLLALAWSTPEREVAPADEWFHDPESSSCPDLRGCAGHFRTIQSCTECGETADSDGIAVVHREWPCPTVQRIRAVLGTQVA